MKSVKAAAPAILFLNRVSFVGGVERVVLLAMDQAREHGFHPILACPGDGEFPAAARQMGFEVEPCAFERMQMTSNPFALARYAANLKRESSRLVEICRTRNVALLHSHSPVTAMYARKAAEKCAIPLIMHIHEALPPRRFYAWATRYGAKAAARFVCVSEAARKMAEDLGLPAERMDVVYNGIDPAFLDSDHHPAADITGLGPHIAIVGVIAPLKGQHVFLGAAARVADEYPTAQFYVVGAVAFESDQPYMDEVKKLASHPSLQGRVTFTGYRSDVANVMAAMDVLVMASVVPESLGMVILEAMALGRKVVATNIGGAPEIIRNGETGLLVPPGDPDALAAALRRLINPPAGGDMGRRAAVDVRERFSPARFGNEMAAVYHKVLAARSETGVAA